MACLECLVMFLGKDKESLMACYVCTEFDNLPKRKGEWINLDILILKAETVNPTDQSSLWAGGRVSREMDPVEYLHKGRCWTRRVKLMHNWQVDRLFV